MALFGRKLTTAEQVLEAYKNLSDEEKTKFEQSLKDRVDESVGEQEHDDGNEDTQTAADRVDESEGEERAEEADKEETETAEEEPKDEGGEEEVPVEEETQPEELPAEEEEEETEASTEEVEERADETYKAIAARIDELVARLEKLEQLVIDSEEGGKAGEFGATQSGDMSGDEEETDDDRVMRTFYGHAYRK